MAKKIQVVLTVSADKSDFPKDGDGRNWVLIYDGKKKIWQAIDRDALFIGLTNRIDKLASDEKAFEDAISTKEKDMEDKEAAYETKINSTVSETLALIEPLVKENKE